MRTFIEIDGKRYEWRVNHDIDTWSCLLCAGFRSTSVCAASCCSEMSGNLFLKLAKS